MSDSNASASKVLGRLAGLQQNLENEVENVRKRRRTNDGSVIDLVCDFSPPFQEENYLASIKV